MLRVLVVEDEVLVAYDVAQMVEDLGATVVGPAYDLHSGLTLAKANSIDLALLDVHLGPETSKPLADYLATKDIPYILVSGYSRSYLQPQFGDVTLVSKPCTREDLRNAIRSTLPEKFSG